MDNQTLHKIQDRVQAILEETPAARSSDYHLFAEYLHRWHPSVCDKSIETVFLHARRYGLPSYESITRCRRKLQAANPDLRPANDGRLAQMDIYVEYALEGRNNRDEDSDDDEKTS